MIAHLRGVLAHVSPDSLILDVHGVGYKVFTSTGTLSQAGLGDEMKLHTHTLVREDLLALYGFAAEEELRLFEQLLSVSGVGPKAALSIVSAVPPSAFGLAVLTDDTDRLAKAQGVGKKTAQRIILELKDKIKKAQPSIDAAGVWMQSDGEMEPEGTFSEACSALMMLGYSRQEAMHAATSVMDPAKTVETIVRDALRKRGSML